MQVNFSWRALAVVAALVTGSGVQAQSNAAPLLEVGLQARIDALADQAPQSGFEQGMLLSLRAVEKALQTRYAYGLGDRMAEFPILRLQLGQSNRSPKPVTPETMTQIFQTLADDLDAARAPLEQAASSGQITAFELTLQDLWFDVNANGSRDKGEVVIELLGPMLLGARAMGEMRKGGILDAPVTVRFDTADHAWLMAYTHMLSGLAEGFIAFDPTPVLVNLAEQKAVIAQAPTVPNYYDQEVLKAEIESLIAKNDALQASLDVLRAQEKAMRAEYHELRQAKPRDEAAIEASNAQLRTFQRENITPLRREVGFLRGEINAAKAKLDGPGRNMLGGMERQLDALYVLLAAIRQQPDPDRINAVRDHLLQMIAQNEVFWSALAEETDNDREWIPNPQQISALPVVVDRQTAETWQAILYDAQAVIEGRLLVPHPLLPHGTGISLKAYFDDPSGVEIVDWIHGIGVYKYAAKGPQVSAQRWRAFQRLTGGNAGGFALFFN